MDHINPVCYVYVVYIVSTFYIWKEKGQYLLIYIIVKQMTLSLLFLFIQKSWFTHILWFKERGSDIYVLETF